MSYAYEHYKIDSNMHSYTDCEAAKFQIKKLYRTILNLTKATPLHQEKLYNDFVSYCDARDELTYEKRDSSIEKRRKELSFLHLKKHMETELTQKQVLETCNNLNLTFSDLIFENIRGFSDGKIQIKELLMSLHEQYLDVCISQSKYKESANYNLDKKNSLDFMSKVLQSPNKLLLNKFELENRLVYLSCLSADIFAILSNQQYEHLTSTTFDYFDEVEKNEYEKVNNFVSYFDKNILDEILKRYNVSSFEKLCEKYDKLRNQYENTLKLSKTDIKIRISPTLAVASHEIEQLYSSGFFEFPPSISEMKELINNRIVHCASEYHGTSPDNVEYETKLLEFYKNGCKELSEEQVVMLYKRIREKDNQLIDRIINLTEENEYKTDFNKELEIKKLDKQYDEKAKKYQKVFVKIILEKRNITNPTESDYIEIIKDVLNEQYDHINVRYTSEATYVDSDTIGKNKEK